MSRVVVVGSSNTDMSLTLPRLPERGQTLLGGRFQASHGGKGANQAVAARRAGADVVFVSAIGDDPMGCEAIAHYQHEGIDTQFIKVVKNSPSGVALIFVGENGENMIGVAPGANEHLTPDDINQLPESLFTAGDVLLVSLEIPIATAATALARGRRKGMITILNPAPAPALNETETSDLLSLAHVITPNRLEAQVLSGLQGECDTIAGCTNHARRLRSLGPDTVVITLGSDGSLLFEDEPQIVPAINVTAVDTVGAGDAFNGALAMALLKRTMPIVDCVRWACAAAALAVTKPGAQSALPYRNEIENLIRTPKQHQIEH